ncbi:hypothetical protein HMF3257_18530 [Spirosoma telluris]|uniref:T9SS type A sorting domain-containing protein n=2 Tax=Spirosoma telluris TaxID=2183553 RepID=A0A327NJW7_9BACT|nr:hypothetical protein HMF3257_18530 [Spirosoma telluris]
MDEFSLHCTSYSVGNGQYRKYVWLQFPDLTPKLVINPNIDMTLVGKEIAVLYQDSQQGSKMLNFINAANAAIPIFDRTEENPNHSYDVTQLPEFMNVPMSFVLRLTFLTSTGKKVILCKTYPLDGSIVNSIDIMQKISGPIGSCGNISGRIAAEEVKEVVPFNLTLGENPFHEELPFSYQVPEKGEVKAKLFDIMGRVVNQATLDGTAGTHQTSLKANSANIIPPGVYLLRLEYQAEQQMKVLSQKVVKQ